MNSPDTSLVHVRCPVTRCWIESASCSRSEGALCLSRQDLTHLLALLLLKEALDYPPQNDASRYDNHVEQHTSAGLHDIALHLGGMRRTVCTRPALVAVTLSQRALAIS